MISGEEARERAEGAIEQAPVRHDPHFTPWVRASVGDPVLVHALWSEPSYWLAPVMAQDRAVGFVRVLGDGRVSAIGALYRDPDHPETAPARVTGLDAAEATRRAADWIEPVRGEALEKPIYVHDGPPGREAWLVPVRARDRVSCWLFVTAAGVYERRAGEERDGGRE